VSIEEHTFDMDFYLTQEWLDGRNFSALFSDENLVEQEPDSCDEPRSPARSAPNPHLPSLSHLIYHTRPTTVNHAPPSPPPRLRHRYTTTSHYHSLTTATTTPPNQQHYHHHHHRHPTALRPYHHTTTTYHHAPSRALYRSARNLFSMSGKTERPRRLAKARTTSSETFDPQAGDVVM
jgi:hypothetical protein